MIIDIRLRYLTSKDVGYFPRSSKLACHDTPASFFAWLKNVGVDVALSPVAPSLGLKLGRWDLPARHIDNDLQAALQAQYPENFVGVAGIDPGNEVHNGLEELDRCVHQLGLRIATIEPGRKPLLAEHPADRRLYEFYALAEEWDVPVIIQTSGLKGGVTIDYAHPRWIDQVAHDFPKLHVICAHGCTPYHRELAFVTRRRPNVFASPDIYTFSDFNACRSTHPGQLIFASGFPFGDVGRMKRTYLEAPWGKTHSLEDLMFRNAIRALKLERLPYFAEKLNSRV